MLFFAVPSAEFIPSTVSGQALTKEGLRTGLAQKTFWCREPELNRHGPFGPRDFKSRVSTRFHHPGTHEVIFMEVTIHKVPRQWFLPDAL